MSLPPTLPEIGLVGVLGIYLIDKGINLVYKLARRNGNNKINRDLVEVEKTIATMQANQANMTGVVSHIESEGSICFQKHEAGDVQWKSNAARSAKSQSVRIDVVNEGLAEVNKTLIDLLAQHKMNHPPGGA